MWEKRGINSCFSGFKIGVFGVLICHETCSKASVYAVSRKFIPVKFTGINLKKYTNLYTT